jgi:ABC-type Na+ efflux pump permease subunit
MDARVEGLAELLKQKVEKTAAEAKFKTYIDKDRVIISVSEGGIKSAISEFKKRPKKKVSAVTEQQKEQIKKVRKNLKGNLDLMNLVILLVRVKEEMKRIDLKALSQEQMDTLKQTVTEFKDSSVLQKLLLEDKR